MALTRLGKRGVWKQSGLSAGVGPEYRCSNSCRTHQAACQARKRFQATPSPELFHSAWCERL
eukprot:238978-Alexandrium_andersonii.AAC.1